MRHGKRGKRLLFGTLGLVALFCMTTAACCGILAWRGGLPVETVPAKTVLTRQKAAGSWFGVDYTMNLYRGCCHGCIYCDSRSDCYRIEDFDRVRAKENALVLLRDELQRKMSTGVVGMGAMSDPYNPFEETEQLTRHALELLYAYGFGTALATKSDLVTRDIAVLADMAGRAPVLVKITITTTDDALAAKIEPHAPPPSRRLAAIRALSGAGICTGVLLMPVLPFLEDTEEQVTAVVRRAAENGARFVYPAFGVTLRRNQRDYFLDRLEEQFPGQGLKERYIRRFGTAYACRSPRARALWAAFTAACGETGLLYRMQDIIRAYRQGYGTEQLRLF